MSNKIEHTLKSTIRTIPDFPIDGIMFRDISPILSDGKLLKDITDRFSEIIKDNNWSPDLILGPESRGFIFGSLLAAKLGIGFIPVRKPGKLPSSKIHIEYSLEYGSNILEMHDDAISKGQKIIIIDDLLATGGTVEACTKLCEQLGGEVISNLFVIELEGLSAREKLHPIPCISLIKYTA
jgi:adenine phosphoribosyltransferase